MTLAAALILALAAPAPAAEQAPPLIYAFIVANNRSLDGARAPLRFADDDGARYAELFASRGDQVRLFTVLDADTQRLFPELVTEARPPERAAILAALEETFADIRRVVDGGRQVAFYFIFSGHGDVDAGEGYVHLLDGPWTRADLFAHVIRPSPATVNHVIIDACNAYFLVAQRGGQAQAAGDYSTLIRDFVGRDRLERYPNTGVVLSTASASEVHEWGRLEAGIFSHELRSALSGAADATGDGLVDYHETAAYLAAANGALPDRKTRLQIYARPPARNVDEPLFWLQGRGVQITVPSEWSGRFYLEDDRGVRVADFHKSAEAALRLEVAPRPRYYLRGASEEYDIEAAPPPSEVLLAGLTPRPLERAARGAAHEAFERYLYAIPYGPGFLRGHQQAELGALAQTEVIEIERPLRPWIYTSAALGGALAVTSGALAGMAYAAAEDYRKGAGPAAEIAATRGRAEDFQYAAIATGSLALTGAATALVLYWLED